MYRAAPRSGAGAGPEPEVRRVRPARHERCM